MTDVGRILLVGDSAAVNLQLLAAVGASPASQLSDWASAASPAVGAAPAQLHLDTKYYTADAQVELCHVDQRASLQLNDGSYEAVLLVFDVNRQASFEAVQAWYEGGGGGEADLPIRLAVGTGLHRLPRQPGGQPVRPPWLVDAEEWCAQQLVELVETGEEALREAAGVTAAAEAAAADGDGGGTTGAARVREALEAYMWPGLRLKATPRHSGPAIAAAAAAEAAEAEAAAATALLQRQQGQGRVAANGPMAGEGVVPAANGAPGGGQAAAAAAAADEDISFTRLLQAPQPALASAAAAGAGSGAATAGPGAAAAAGEEGEVEQLERLFAQVAGHRERLAALPDAQRREQAAGLVMQLMAAMGLEEGDEGEGDEA